MSDRSKVDEVMSGVPYVVTDVNHHSPAGLSDFLDTDVTVVTAAAGSRRLTFCGPARVDGEAVVLYEKDHDGAGKDVRTWEIRSQDGGFQAVERSIF